MGSLRPSSKTDATLIQKNQALELELETLREQANRRQGEEEKLTAIIEASGRLLKILKRDEVAGAVLDLCHDLIVADGYAIWRKDAGGGWDILKSSGLSEQYAKAIVAQVNAGGPQRTELQKALWVENVFAAPWGAAMADLYRNEGIHSLLVSPLEFDGHTIGTITLYFRSPHAFNPSDNRVATALADLAAGAISSSELYEERVAMWHQEMDEKLRAGFLAEVGVVLGSTLDYKKTLESIAQMAVPYIADWCVVDMLGDNGTLEMLAVAHVDPKKIEQAKEFRERFPPNLEDSGAYAMTFKTGRPQLVETISPEMLDPIPPGEVRDFLLSLSLQSSMIIPIRIRGRSVGVITFIQSESGRHFQEVDLSLAQELARRAALSIDNAKLYHRAQEALEARDDLLHKLHKQIQQQAALMAVSQRGLSRIDLKTLLEDTAFWLTKTLKVDQCVILEPRAEDPFFSVTVSLGWPADEFSRHLREDASGKLFQRVLKSSSPFLIESRQTEEPFGDLSIFRDGGVVSAILTQIKTPESVFGLIAAFSPHQNSFSQDDIQFLQSVANIIAAAVDRIETESALSTSERKYRQLFDLSPSGIVIADAEFRITGANGEAREIFGYPSEKAMLGSDLKRLVLPQAARARQAGASPTLEDGIRDQELLLQRIDGSEFPAEVSAEAISDQRGTHVAYFAIVRDITQRKELEDMKNEFITTVSHELRTPLTSIFVSLGLIASGNVPLTSEKAWPLIDIAHKNCLRLIQLVNDFLDFQKLESGKIQLDLKETPLAPLVTQAVVMNQSYAEQYGAQFVLELGCPDALAVIDPDRFLQVLTNLLSNAAKFSPRGAQVVVGTRCSDASVRVSVTNHGPPIPEEHRKKLFTKFVQVDASLGRKRQGSGLGLAISKSLVEEMGGAIDFSSSEEETEFFLEFPILHPGLSGGAYAESDPHPGS